MPLEGTMKVQFNQGAVDKIMQMAKEKTLEVARDRVRGLRCSVHGQQAKLEVVSENSSGYTVKVVTPCCEDFLKQIKAALGPEVAS
jgi:hypothetical protein